MSNEWELTDEEISDLWAEYDKNDPWQKTPFDRVIVKAQAKKLVGWYKENSSPHYPTLDIDRKFPLVSNGRFIPEYKWQKLLKEVEVG